MKAEAEVSDLDADDHELAGSSFTQSRLRVMLSRAVMVYLVLFMGLSLLMSLLGVNPLANNGLMPKALLVFVGLALLMALANSAADLNQEQGQSLLSLVRGLIRSTRDRES